MDQAVKPFMSEATDTRRWIARIIMAVILGEAIWGLIISVMNNVVVPWLGDVMGQSSGLPTSFTQRPYDYPDLFVSVLEFGVAALVAAVLNYFFQGRPAKTINTVKSSAPAAAEPARVFPPPASTAALTQTPSPYTPATPVTKTEPVAATVPAVVSPAPPVAPAPPSQPMAVASPAAPVTEAAAKPSLAPAVASPAPTKPPSAPTAEPAKPKKPKNVYYNIVGEPMPSDDD